MAVSQPRPASAFEPDAPPVCVLTPPALAADLDKRRLAVSQPRPASASEPDAPPVCVPTPPWLRPPTLTNAAWPRARAYAQMYSLATLAVLFALRAVPASSIPLQWAVIAMLGFTIYGPQ
eukprot:364769-Chlamydomonas_euryale.AAC.1